MKPLLTLGEAARLLRVSEKTLYSQRYRGEAPGALGIRVGRYVRFYVEDLEEWCNRQRQATKNSSWLPTIERRYEVVPPRARPPP